MQTGLRAKDDDHFRHYIIIKENESIQGTSTN